VGVVEVEEEEGVARRADARAPSCAATPSSWHGWVSIWLGQSTCPPLRPSGVAGKDWK